MDIILANRFMMGWFDTSVKCLENIWHVVIELIQTHAYLSTVIAGYVAFIIALGWLIWDAGRR